MTPSLLALVVSPLANAAGRTRGHLVAWTIMAVCGGCHTIRHNPQLVIAPPTFHQRWLAPVAAPQFHVVGHPGNVAGAEELLSAAETEERDGQERCVDLYYRAARLSLGSLSSRTPGGDVSQSPVWEIYRRAVAGLLLSAQQFGRFSPERGIQVNAVDGPRVIPVEYHGFAWRPQDFSELLLAADYQSSDIRRHFLASGMGVSLVAVQKNRENEVFFNSDQPFAATAVLQPAATILKGETQVTARQAMDVSLGFYNPLVYDRITVGNVTLPLERDLTAPLAYMDRQGGRNWLTGFLDPLDPTSRPKLTMLEPYQRGKTPAVFIHGLLSQPLVWADLVNELRARPEIYSRFQFWVYRYPTGSGFLDSAATFRELLQLARESSDPHHLDGSLDQMVLVGHSMGGLMAKTQITESWDIPWQHFASQPIDSVRAPPEEREKLRRLFFFEPSASVSRVVFIGTPHQGSSWSRRMIGQVGTSLVRFDSEEERRYQTLVDANQDIILPRFQRAQPTSVELLDPDSPLLVAMAKMPVKRGVRVHTIVGAAERTIGGEPSDGVVTASSARHPRAVSELWVDARHSELHHDTATIAEVRRILLEHAVTTSSGDREMTIVNVAAQSREKAQKSQHPRQGSNL